MENEIETNEQDDSSLLDCYRIALDFGMPAALKAYEKLTPPSKANTTDSLTLATAEESAN